jgi:hypothetical protein
VHHRSSRAPLSRALVLLTLAAGVFGSARAAVPAERRTEPHPTTPSRTNAPTRAIADGALIGDSLFGRSGKLRARLVSASRALDLTFLARLFGDSVVGRPDVYAVPDSATPRPFAFITLLPFGAKSNGRIGPYRVGVWPSERGSRSANPDGFIRVTRENQDTHVSEHFRLRDFLTHDQQHVWPKYLVLREELLDKLELVIADLEAHGTRVSRMTVMSGFRTPQYNRKGVGAGGRARDSRHQYGDAADVFVDNDGDGWMDDLTGDGRVDHRDAQVIIDAAERVERAYPELVGGAGLYRANRVHGPFAHVDVRGRRARWGNA